MQAYDGLSQFDAPTEGVVLTIGNFDGVHVGHQRILAAARESARQAGGIRVVAMTFEPHPSAILAPHRAPARLTTHAEKLELLGRHGADQAIVLRAEPSLFAQPAIDFLNEVVLRCRPRAIVEGPSFMFGRGRDGDVTMLLSHASRLGYALFVVASQSITHGGVATPVSSSAVRAALANADVELAARMLGRPHVLSGIVVAGAGRGAGIGVPTANLARCPQLCPAPAVYAAAAQIEGEPLRPAAVNIGAQPTFGDEQRRIEAHILDFSGDLRGRTLRLYFLRTLRQQRKFDSVQKLTNQIRRDIDATREMTSEMAGIVALA